MIVPKQRGLEDRAGARAGFPDNQRFLKQLFETDLPSGKAVPFPADSREIFPPQGAKIITRFVKISFNQSQIQRPPPPAPAKRFLVLSTVRERLLSGSAAR